MASPPEPSHAPAARLPGGTGLVTLQLVLLAGLSWAAAPVFLQGRASAFPWLLIASGAAVGFWALSANRPGNFNIRPDPKAGGQLVLHGPYRWIRHPMYTSIVLWSAGCALARPDAGGWLAALALVAVLLVKSTLEERGMLATHPGYADYRRRSWRFVPGIF